MEPISAVTPLDQPIISELAYRTYHICEFGMDSMFYLEGDDRALLIDTGTGTFDIPSFIKAHFGDKPYDVVLTRGHVGYARWLNLVSQSPLVIPECIQPCEDLLDSTVVGKESPGFGGVPVRIAQSRTGAMQIQYVDWQVR